MHSYTTNWSRNHQQIAHSSYFVKRDMKLGVNMVNATVLFATSTSCLIDVNHFPHFSCNTNCWRCFKLK